MSEVVLNLIIFGLVGATAFGFFGWVPQVIVIGMLVLAVLSIG